MLKPLKPPLRREDYEARERTLFARILEHFIGDDRVPLLSAEDFRERYGQPVH